MDIKEIQSNRAVDLLAKNKRQAKQIKGLKTALRKIKEHEEYLGIPNVYYDAQVFITADKALKQY